jgi:Na+/melibiose symporter-like transporter
MYTLFGILFVCIILSQPLWALISKKIDKKPALLLGMAITLSGALYIFAIVLGLIKAENTEALLFNLYPCLIVSGIGIGSLYPLPYSIMADTIAYNTVKNKEDRTATFTGFMTFSFKLSQALTLLLIGLLLEIIGFKVPEGTEIYLPSMTAQRGLGYIFCIGVVITMVAGIVLFSGYGLKKADIPTHDNVKSPSFEVDRLISVLEYKEKKQKGKL